MTDKKTEALKLALEALELLHPITCRDRITAIREALAEQPAQQQEPVATVTSESGNPNVSMSWWHEPALPVGTKLYTSPPASKPWVSLTDEEIAEIEDGYIVDYRIPAGCGWNFAKDIEAKLKEKNQ